MSNSLLSQRYQKLPHYILASIDDLKRELRAKGHDLIDLGIGAPDFPAPKFIVDTLIEEAKKAENHRYAPFPGMKVLREAISGWYKKRFQVDLDVEKEILPLVGSKEGIVHFIMTVVDKGDATLVPSPAYPAYRGGTILAGGQPIVFPLIEENNFLPDFNELEKLVKKSKETVKLLFLNYPNNPTAACADLSFYERAVEFAKKHGIIICHDAAYSELYLDDNIPPSIFQVKGAKEIAVEFHSCSKTYNMTGWRIGFVSGEAKLIQALKKVKSNLDTGIFQPIQLAAAKALSSNQDFVADYRLKYKKRRDVFLSELSDSGLTIFPTKATFYVWIKMPDTWKKGSLELSKYLMEKGRVVLIPGISFGKYGEGYIRASVNQSEALLIEAAKRIKSVIK